MLIFLVGLTGALLGLIMGGTLGVRYLRREVADDLGLKLKRLQLQLDNIEAELNLALVTRYAELGARPALLASCRRERRTVSSRGPGVVLRLRELGPRALQRLAVQEDVDLL